MMTRIVLAELAALFVLLTWKVIGAAVRGFRWKFLPMEDRLLLPAAIVLCGHYGFLLQHIHGTGLPDIEGKWIWSYGIVCAGYLAAKAWRAPHSSLEEQA